jgi:hypothetical protein
MVPRDFVYNDNMLRVNNPTNPTIEIAADNELVNNLNGYGADGQTPSTTRTIIIDNERFEIPEQLF